MKACKSCRKEIEDNATKCPFCQSFQQKWRNPQIISLIFVLPMMLLPLYMTGIVGGANFADYKKEIILTEQNSFSDNAKSSRFILQVDNRTSKTWTNPSVQILFKDAKGAIVGVANESEYSFKVPSQTKSLFEVKAEMPANAVSHTIELTSMRSGRLFE